MPSLLDLFCGAGGAAMGYHRAGFDQIVGVDIKPQPRYPFEFVQADALEYLEAHGQEFDAIHASPPCQGYSIINNLPWLKDREYPLLILPTIEMLEALGKPYCLENVMGARNGAKGLKKRGLENHGLKAGWLCGDMFGLPFYRHRLFATNWFWLAPGHPKHILRQGMSSVPLPRELWEERYKKRTGREWEQAGNLKLRTGLEHIPFSAPMINRANIEWRVHHDGIRTFERADGTIGRYEPKISMASLDRWQGNGAQAEGVGVGHAKGWHKAAEAMGINWMKREELTQAIPPVYTEFIGKELLRQIA